MFRTMSKTFLYGFLLISFLFVGCKSDNPIEPGDDDHLEVVGLFLRLDGVRIVTVQNGQVSGEVELREGVMTSLVSIRFLDEDGDDRVPDGDDFRLEWEIADANIAGIVQHEEDGKWRFHFVGKEAGETTVTFRLMHVDHADFVSPPIPIHVHHDDEEREIVGLLLIHEASGDTLVTLDQGVVTGKIAVKVGEDSGHIEVKFKDAGGDYFTPSANVYALQLVVANSDIAEIELEENEPFAFEVAGKQAGSTTFKLSLIHDGHSDFDSPDITIEVTQ